MKINCRYCGAQIDSSAKICSGCGKVLPTYNQAAQEEKKQFSNYGGAQGVLPGARNNVRTTYAATRSAREMQQPMDNYGADGKNRRQPDADYDPIKQAAQQRVPFTTNASSGKQQNRSRIMPVVSGLIKLIVAAVVLYVLYVAANVVWVRQSGYDFKLGEGIKLESSNYGQAFGNYFEDGKWWYDFEANKVTYEGTSYDGAKYEMTFAREDGQMIVKNLTIDDKKIKGRENIMNNYILGMFMVEKEHKGGPTALG